MNAELITARFARMGARARLGEQAPGGRIRLDIDHDRTGEFFRIDVNGAYAPVLRVVDVRPRERHLLLLVDDGPDTPDVLRSGKQKFLCGHDERHWFVAAIPEASSASNVPTALDALKPPSVRWAEARAGVKSRNRNRRRNAAFVRQGEWFFIPEPDLSVDRLHVLHREPLRRGDGKPHVAEWCCRLGGERVYVNAQFPQGLTDAQHRRWQGRNAGSRLQFAVQRRNPTVYVRGRVSHGDHATIRLAGWHRVVMNTETQAEAMRHVAFID